MRLLICAGVAVMVLSATPAASQVTYSVFTPQESASEQTAAAQPNRGAKSLVSLDVRDSTIEYAVRTMAQQARLRIVFNVANAVLSTRVTVSVDKMNVLDAIGVVLQGTGLSAKLTPAGETVMIVSTRDRAGTKPRAPAGTIVGRVTDSVDGRGLKGAMIKVVGTKLMTTTGDSGRFTLRGVPNGEQALSIKFFGYRPAERSVLVPENAQVTVRISLAPMPNMLLGVVTTASGVQERSRVGSDIIVLNADSIQRVAPVSSVTDLLETRVPGLMVLHTSGIPGAPSRLRLRGTSSLERSNDPIVIVDGIRISSNQFDMNHTRDVGRVSSYLTPSPIDQIDPNSVETIEVFKGPSASAMYGSDAANGVIVITTKRGRAGATHWTATLEGGRTSLRGDGYPLNYFRFGHVFNEFPQRCQLFDAACLTDSVVAYQALNDPRVSPISHGGTRGASFTVSGGANNMTYSATGTAAEETGYLRLPAVVRDRFAREHGFAAPSWMTHPDGLTTYGANTRVEVGFGTNGGTIAFTGSLNRGEQSQSSLQTLLQELQTQYVDTSASAFGLGHVAEGAQLDNPRIFTRVRNTTWTLSNGVSVLWPVFSWLPLRGSAGLNYTNSEYTELEPRNYNFADTLGRYGVTHGKTINGTLDFGTTLQLQPGGHGLGTQLTVGFNALNESNRTFSGFADGLAAGETQPANFDCNQRVTNGDRICSTEAGLSQTTYGWYIEPRFDIGSRFFINPGIRLDGGSASGANAGVSPFPKINVSWLAVDRPDRPLFGVLTSLRPRLAFGIAGVQPAPGDKFRLYSSGQVRDANGNPVSVTVLNTFGNTRLRPERSRELEGGFEAILWNSRLSLSMTPYYKLRYDALLTTPLAPSIGGTRCVGSANCSNSFSRNIGNVRNTGLDASMGVRLLDAPAVSWQVNTNLHKNSNVVLSLAPDFVVDGRKEGADVLAVGYPIFGVWARPIAGYADANGNGRIDVGEVAVRDTGVFLGTGEATYELSMSTTLSLFNGRLSFNTALDYQNGLTQTNIGGGPTIFSRYNAPGMPLGQQAAVVAGTSAAAGTFTTLYGQIQTVDMLRWSTLAMTYQVPSRFAKYFRSSFMSLSLQGRNLGLRTNYRGQDPNVNAYATGNSVQDLGQLPPPRMWQLRVSLGN